MEEQSTENSKQMSQGPLNMATEASPNKEPCQPNKHQEMQFKLANIYKEQAKQGLQMERRPLGNQKNQKMYLKQNLKEMQNRIHNFATSMK